MPFCDFVYARCEANRSLPALLLRCLRSHPTLRADFLFLARAVQDSAALYSASQAPRRSVLTELRRAWNYLPCESMDAVNARLSQKFRSNLRNRMRRLMQLGAVEFSNVRDPAGVEPAFQSFMDVEASGWKGARGTETAIKLQPDVHRLYSAMVRNFAPGGHCEINLLRVDGRVIAGQLCLVVGDTCYLLVLGYDEEYAKVSPGVLLCEDLVRRHAASQDVRYVDLFGDAEWHDDWEPLRQHFFRCYMFDASARGTLASLLIALRRALRPAYLSYWKPARRLLQR
jgi:CelD/BcsL family acetyltransferase involved in cellulose biosynthesis